MAMEIMIHLYIVMMFFLICQLKNRRFAIAIDTVRLLTIRNSHAIQHLLGWRRSSIATSDPDGKPSDQGRNIGAIKISVIDNTSSSNYRKICFG
jgi:hypothetical protein